MRFYESLEGEGEVAHPCPKDHPLYTFIKDILLPTVSLAATILFAYIGKQKSIIMILAVLTVALFSFGLYPSVAASLRKRASRAEDEQVARREFPNFKQLVHRYGEFVDTRTNNTLHAIITMNISEPSRSDFTKRLGTPTISLWHEFWHFFVQRIDRQRPSLSEFAQTVSEFHNMVAQYNNFCVAPIFETLPNEARSALIGTDRSALNGFQQTFANFIDDYTAFAKDLSASRPSLERLPNYLPRPKPL